MTDRFLGLLQETTKNLKWEGWKEVEIIVLKYSDYIVSKFTLNLCI